MSAVVVVGKASGPRPNAVMMISMGGSADWSSGKRNAAMTQGAGKC